MVHWLFGEKRLERSVLETLKIQSVKGIELQKFALDSNVTNHFAELSRFSFLPEQLYSLKSVGDVSNDFVRNEAFLWLMKDLSRLLQ